jgi:hypothetical protein
VTFKEHPDCMKWIKGTKKGRKRELKTGVFTVAFFRPLFASFFFSFHPISHVGPRFFGFTPFLHVEIEKGKKTRRKTAGIQKREKKGSEKGRKKGYCEQP